MAETSAAGDRRRALTQRLGRRAGRTRCRCGGGPDRSRQIFTARDLILFCLAPAPLFGSMRTRFSRRATLSNASGAGRHAGEGASGQRAPPSDAVCLGPGCRAMAILDRRNVDQTTSLVAGGPGHRTGRGGHRPRGFVGDRARLRPRVHARARRGPALGGAGATGPRGRRASAPVARPDLAGGSPRAPASDATRRRAPPRTDDRRERGHREPVAPRAHPLPSRHGSPPRHDGAANESGRARHLSAAPVRGDRASPRRHRKRAAQGRPRRDPRAGGRLDDRGRGRRRHGPAGGGRPRCFRPARRAPRRGARPPRAHRAGRRRRPARGRPAPHPADRLALGGGSDASRRRDAPSVAREPRGVPAPQGCHRPRGSRESGWSRSADRRQGAGRRRHHRSRRGATDSRPRPDPRARPRRGHGSGRHHRG